MESLKVFSPESVSPRPRWNASGATLTPTRIPRPGELALFRLGDNWFGVDLDQVERVVPLNYATWVTLDHGLILGTVGLHGRLFPVIDLKALLGSGSSSRSDHGAILVARAEDTEVGILADEFDDVFMVAGPEAGDRPDEPQHGPVLGTCLCGNRTVTIIDPVRVIESLRERAEPLTA